MIDADLTTKVKLLSEKAELPRRAHDTDTGYDVKLIDMERIVGDVILFKTGLSLSPPSGHYFDIVPRSSISKLPLMLANSVGTVDEHYRGEIMVPIRVLHSRIGDGMGRERLPGGIVSIFDSKPQSLHDVARLILDKKPFLIQLVLKKRLSCDFDVVEILDETERGDGGFGSTDDGIKQTVTKASERKGMVRRVV